MDSFAKQFNKLDIKGVSGSSLIVERFRNLKTFLQHLIKMPSSTTVAKKHSADLSEVINSVTTSTSSPAFLKFVKISGKA